MKARHLMKSIWAKKIPQSALKKTRLASGLDNEDDEGIQSPPMPRDSDQPSSLIQDGPENLDTAESLAEAMPSATSSTTGSSSATEASLATETSTTTKSLLQPENAHRPWERVHEILPIMKLGEPGRLALLASTYSSAESRAALTRPGEPEMSWEEVQTAVRKSRPRKRKFDDDEGETDESPRPAKMSRFEERTAMVDVYALPKNPNTTFHPTKPRLKHALPTVDEEELHPQKKRRYDGPPSILGLNRTPRTGDAISPILRPIKLSPFDAKEDESPHQEPKEADWRVPVNCPTPAVPNPEVESSLPPAQAVASTISVPINESTPSVLKVQIERSPPHTPAVTSAIELSFQPPEDSLISIPESPPGANSVNYDGSDKEGEILTLFSLRKLGYINRAQAQKNLRLARYRARRSKDKRLVKAMEESQRLRKELGPIKHTGTRPPPSIPNDDSHNNDEDEKVYSSPECMKDQFESSHTTVEEIIQSANEARRRAGFGTAKEENEVVVQAQREEIQKDEEVPIKIRARGLRHHLPEEESLLQRLISESEAESESEPESKSKSESES